MTAIWAVALAAWAVLRWLLRRDRADESWPGWDIDELRAMKDTSAWRYP